MTEPLMSDEDFRRRLEHHRPGLLRHCRRLTRTSEEAEDLCQDTMATGWERRASYQGTGSFRAWLFGIATYRSMNARRKKAELLSDDGILDPRESHFQLLGQITREERAMVVQDSVKACLEPLDQEIAWARYQQHLSVKEITELFELEGSGARGALQRIKRKLGDELRARLAELGHGTSFVRTCS